LVGKLEPLNETVVLQHRPVAKARGKTMRWLKALRVTLPVIAILAGMPAASYAATATIRIVITRAGFVVGHGTGTLHFQGKRYPLRIGGVNSGPLGATGVDLLGRAYHIRTAGNIHGIYSRVDGGAGEATTIRLRNWHGVVLELRGRRGVKPTVDLSGMEISLRR
jgi:hypothetical protein